MKKDLKERIEDILQEKIIDFPSVSGGCITDNYLLTTKKRNKYFLKTGSLAKNMFLCEANGLNEITKSQAIRTPQVISVGEDFLLLEAISSLRPSGKNFYKAFSRKLARMHRYQADQFGLFEDNFIGKTLQLNIAEDPSAHNWTLFYFEKRLLFQYRLAENKGYISPRLQKAFLHLENHIENILGGSEEPPCLLHGDLWSGNYLCDENDLPVLIDPAVYYGHREADLAMTRLFGGFPPSFYKSYQETYPLLSGWENRVHIYKLYHVLNHLNMFGSGYLREAEELACYYL